MKSEKSKKNSLISIVGIISIISIFVSVPFLLLLSIYEDIEWIELTGCILFSIGVAGYIVVLLRQTFITEGLTGKTVMQRVECLSGLTRNYFWMSACLSGYVAIFLSKSLQWDFTKCMVYMLNFLIVILWFPLYMFVLLKRDKKID